MAKRGGQKKKIGRKAKQEYLERRSLDIISSVKVKQQNLSIFRDLKGTLKIIQFIGIWF